MTKLQFILSLNARLSGLPREEREEQLRFYTEMIEDRMEEGLSEEEAVAAISSVDEIATQFEVDTPASPPPVFHAEPQKQPNRAVWKTVLLVLGSPIWLSLLFAGFAVVLSLYASLWAVVISLWAVFASLVGCSFGLLVAGVVFSMGEHAIAGLAMIGAATVCTGLAIFLFFGCRAATNGAVQLVKLPFRHIRRNHNGQ